MRDREGHSLVGGVLWPVTPDETEAVVISTNARQRADSTTSRPTLDLQMVNTKLTASVRSLGVTIDSALSFNEHVDSIRKSSYFHLRALRLINEDTL